MLSVCSAFLRTFRTCKGRGKQSRQHRINPLAKKRESRLRSKTSAEMLYVGSGGFRRRAADRCAAPGLVGALSPQSTLVAAPQAALSHAGLQQHWGGGGGWSCCFTPSSGRWRGTSALCCCGAGQENCCIPAAPQGVQFFAFAIVLCILKTLGKSFPSISLHLLSPRRASRRE